MEFEQKSEGVELVTQISRGWAYESEDTNANNFCEGRLTFFRKAKTGSRSC